MKDVSGRLQGKQIPIINATAAEKACTAGSATMDMWAKWGAGSPSVGKPAQSERAQPGG